VQYGPRIAAVADLFGIRLVAATIARISRTCAARLQDFVTAMRDWGARPGSPCAGQAQRDSGGPPMGGLAMNAKSRSQTAASYFPNLDLSGGFPPERLAVAAAPVRATHNTPSTNRRLSSPLRP
jgi:hypothetical protein